MTFLRKYNTATAAGTHIRIPIIKASSNDFALSADWTPAAGDVKVVKDGGAEANIGTLPTFSNGAWEFQLTGAELSAKTVQVKVVDSATKAVEDQFFIVETFGHASAMYPTDYTAALATAQQATNAETAANNAVTAANNAASNAADAHTQASAAATSAASADGKLPADTTTKINRLDATISSRHSATQQTTDLSAILTAISNVPGLVWAAGTRTLTSFGTLVADVTSSVWSAGSRTITGLSAALELLLHQLDHGLGVRYVSAAGSDGATGKTLTTAWQTLGKLATELAIADNGITEVRFDGEIPVTAQFTIPANAKANIRFRAADGSVAVLNGLKTIAGAWTQYDAVNYPNIWQIADADNFNNKPVLLEDRKGLTHPTGAAITDVRATLNSTAGSFWANGTTLYYHPSGSTNPNTDNKVKERTRVFANGGGNDLVRINNGGVDWDGVNVLGGMNVSETGTNPDEGYSISNLGSGRTVIRNSTFLYWGYHAVGCTSSESGVETIVEDCRLEQGQPYGIQTTMVAYSSNAAAAGCRFIARRCRSTRNQLAIGSTAGASSSSRTALVAHFVGGTPYDLVRVEDCDFAGPVEVQGNVKRLEVLRSTLASVDTAADFTEVGHCTLTRNFGYGTGHVWFHDCQVNDTLNRNGATAEIGGTWTVERCDIDVTGNASVGVQALFTVTSFLRFNFIDNRFRVGGPNQEWTFGVLKDATRDHGLRFERNTYVEANASQSDTTGVSVVMVNYNDGTTTANRTLSQWRALGFETTRTRDHAGDALMKASSYTAPDNAGIAAGAASAATAATQATGANTQATAAATSAASADAKLSNPRLAKIDALTFTVQNRLDVQVMGLQQAALAQFVTDSTGQSSAANQSVAKLSQGAGAGGTTKHTKVTVKNKKVRG